MDSRKLTNADLAEIKKRAEAATGGNWSWFRRNLINDSGELILFPDNEFAIWASASDRLFIEKARQDVPALLAEVERLRNENSLLCPIGDLDVITSLRTEKSMYMERIAELEAEVAELTSIAYANADIGEKLDGFLQDIDTHIRSTPEPIPHILETMRKYLDYREELADDE